MGSEVSPLLARAISDVQTTNLSIRQQDAVAATILAQLAEIEDSKLWQQQFDESHDVLEMLFDESMKEYRAGRTVALPE